MNFNLRFIRSVLAFDFSKYKTKSIHKLLFVFLACRCDQKQVVEVTTDEIMDFCLSTRPTVLSALKYLEDVGLITIRSRKGLSNTYKINVDLMFNENSKHREGLVLEFLALDMSKYKIKSMHKLILIGMASVVRKDYSVSLTVSELMDFCLATKPTIINAIKHLESEGVVLVSQQAGASNIYYMLLDFFPNQADKLRGALKGFNEMPELASESSKELMTNNDNVMRSLASNLRILASNQSDDD